MHNGFAKNRTYYVGLFAHCILEILPRKNKVTNEHEEETLVALLACSPLGNEDTCSKL